MQQEVPEKLIRGTLRTAGISGDELWLADELRPDFQKKKGSQPYRPLRQHNSGTALEREISFAFQGLWTFIERP